MYNMTYLVCTCDGVFLVINLNSYNGNTVIVSSMGDLHVIGQQESVPAYPILNIFVDYGFFLVRTACLW